MKKIQICMCGKKNNESIYSWPFFSELDESCENNHDVYTKYVSLKNPDRITVTAFDTLCQKASLGYKFEQIEVNVHDMKFHKLWPNNNLSFSFYN